MGLFRFLLWMQVALALPFHVVQQRCTAEDKYHLGESVKREVPNALRAFSFADCDLEHNIIVGSYAAEAPYNGVICSTKSSERIEVKKLLPGLTLPRICILRRTILWWSQDHKSLVVTDFSGETLSESSAAFVGTTVPTDIFVVGQHAVGRFVQTEQGRIRPYYFVYDFASNITFDGGRSDGIAGASAVETVYSSELHVGAPRPKGPTIVYRQDLKRGEEEAPRRPVFTLPDAVVLQSLSEDGSVAVGARYDHELNRSTVAINMKSGECDEVRCDGELITRAFAPLFAKDGGKVILFRIRAATANGSVALAEYPCHTKLSVMPVAQAFVFLEDNTRSDVNWTACGRGIFWTDLRKAEGAVGVSVRTHQKQ